MKNDGYTLIELLAVLIILGVLATFAVPKLITVDKTANEQKQTYQTNAETRKDIYNQYLGIEENEEEEEE